MASATACMCCEAVNKSLRRLSIVISGVARLDLFCVDFLALVAVEVVSRLSDIVGVRICTSFMLEYLPKLNSHEESSKHIVKIQKHFSM